MDPDKSPMPKVWSCCTQEDFRRAPPRSDGVPMKFDSCISYQDALKYCQAFSKGARAAWLSAGGMYTQALGSTTPSLRIQDTLEESDTSLMGSNVKQEVSQQGPWASDKQYDTPGSVSGTPDSQDGEGTGTGPALVRFAAASGGFPLWGDDEENGGDLTVTSSQFQTSLTVPTADSVGPSKQEEQVSPVSPVSRSSQLFPVSPLVPLDPNDPDALSDAVSRLSIKPRH